MTDDNGITGELRELVYIDDASINGHLSSMGVGLETGVDKSSGNSESRRARFSGSINVPGLPLNLGGEGEKQQQSTEDIQKQIDITTPYRLQTLREIIDKSESKIKDPTEEGIGYKDIIEVTGVVEPISLFRFEIAEESIININEQTQNMVETAREIGLSPSSESDDEDTDIRANKAFQDVSRELSNRRVPVRMDVDGAGTFGVKLDREKMIPPESEAFSRPRPYTLFGRVERPIKMNSTWEPIDTLRLGKHFTNLGDELDEFSDTVKTAAEDHGIIMEGKHLNISGPAKIIHPLAVYW